MYYLSETNKVMVKSYIEIRFISGKKKKWFYDNDGDAKKDYENLTNGDHWFR